MTQLIYRPLDIARKEDREHLVRWHNDPAIRHLFIRFADEHECRQVLNEHDVARMVEHLDTSRPTGSFILLAGSLSNRCSVDEEFVAKM